MTPRDYFQNIALPNLAEFEKDFGSMRAAFNAVMSADATAAHLFHWLKANHPLVVPTGDDSSYRQTLANRNADFALIRDIAKAQKHVELTRHNPAVSSASQVQPKELGWGEAVWGESRWGSPEQVYVTLNDGTTRGVEAIVRGALDFLNSEMQHYHL